jgi:glycine cleavage system H protein
MDIKTDRKYSASHEWVLFENETAATVGLTDHAQSELGDIVFVNLPQPGDAVTAGAPFAEVESVKAVSEVYSPVTGVVTAVNEALLETPQKINEDPYGAWMVKVTGVTARAELMDADAYRELTKE